MHLPNILRPSILPHKDFKPGYHLPSWFHDDIKALDQHLYFVWHPWRLIYDDVMNQYTGEAHDPRFCIHEYHGEEIWGFPLTDGDNKPIPENKWHIWRLSLDRGWYHIVNIDSYQRDHLSDILNRLALQDKLNKMRRKAYSRYRQEEEE